MGRYVKRVFTAEAVAVGIIFALVIAAVVGGTLGLILRSLGFGVCAGAVMFLLSLDIIFRGTHE